MASSASGASRPLEGVRVLELGSLIAASFCTRMLADFGAEVIKIEDPRHLDPMREWGHAHPGGRSLWWAVQSRGKKSLTLGLKSAGGRHTFEELVRTADILVENLRPGTLERLGIGPEALWKKNAGLIIARISGYGQTGADANKPGYASVAEAKAGLRHLNGFPGGPPPRAGISLGDSLASLHAMQGILMALYWRDTRGGTGQVVDVSLVESCFALLESAVPDYAACGYVAGPSGTGLAGIAPSNIYRSSEGEWIVIAANQDTVFTRLARAMGMPQLAVDPRFDSHGARGLNQEVLDEVIARWAATLTADELNQTLDDNDVPNSRVNDVSAVFTDPLFTEREMLVEIPDDELGAIVHPGIVPKLSRTPGAIGWNGPHSPGEHTRSVLLELSGIDGARLDELSDGGVI